MFSFDHRPLAIKKSGSPPGPLSKTLFVTSTKSYETVYPAHIVQSAGQRKEKASLKRRAQPLAARFPLSPMRSSPACACRQGVARRSGARQLVALERLAQFELVDLAGGGMGDFFHHLHVVGHPPFGDFRLEKFEDVLGLRLMAFLGNDDQERALVPFRMGD